MTARHGNRGFRLRVWHAPGQTVDTAYEAEPDRSQPSWTRTEQAGLALAGAALIVAAPVGSPLVSLVTLPAALLAPGHVLLRTVARRLPADRDPWLIWCLRIVLSLAIWTILGALFVVVPGLDPRWLAVVVGTGLLLLVLATLDLAQPARTVDDPLDPDPAPSPGGRRRNAAVLAAFALVAAGSLAGAYAISTGTSTPPAYLAMSFEPATGTAYTGTGRPVLAAVVRNGGEARLSAVLTVRVDGRAGIVRRIAVPAGGSVTVPTGDIRITGCWTRLTVSLSQITPRPQAAPRALIAYGPATDPAGCTTS